MPNRKKSLVIYSYLSNKGYIRRHQHNIISLLFLACIIFFFILINYHYYIQRIYILNRSTRYTFNYFFFFQFHVRNLIHICKKKKKKLYDFYIIDLFEFCTVFIHVLYVLFCRYEISFFSKTLMYVQIIYKWITV